MMTKWEAKAFEYKDQLIEIALVNFNKETSGDTWVVARINGHDYDLNVWIDDETNEIKITAYPLTYKFLDITEMAKLL